RTALSLKADRNWVANNGPKRCEARRASAPRGSVGADRTVVTGRPLLSSKRCAGFDPAILQRPTYRGDIDIRGSCRARSDRSTAMNRAVIVICDSLRRDLITPADAPFLTELGQRSTRFATHASVFPATTRTSAASIATGCLPARHGLLGNTMALDEGEGLASLSVGRPDLRNRLPPATARTLHVPTLAERVSRSGETAIAISNVSPGAAYFLAPGGFGWVCNPAGSYGPGRRPLPAEEGLAVAKGEAGDAAATE